MLLLSVKGLYTCMLYSQGVLCFLLLFFGIIFNHEIDRSDPFRPLVVSSLSAFPLLDTRLTGPPLIACQHIKTGKE